MSDRPVIFIDDQNESPLNSEAKKYAKKALFYYDLNSKSFYKNILCLLNKPIKEIEELYSLKRRAKCEFIKNFFSKYEGKAGQRTAKFIKDNF